MKYDPRRGWRMDRFIIGMAYVVGGAALVAVWSAVFGWHREAANTAAAWIQAVGSIAAIHWAGRIARQQTEARRKQAAEERVMQLRAAGEMIDVFHGAICKAVDAIEGEESLANRIHEAHLRVRPMRVAEETMMRIPFHELPYAVIARPALNFLHRLQQSLQFLEAISQLNEGDEREGLVLGGALDGMKKARDKAGEDVQKIHAQVATYRGGSR